MWRRVGAGQILPCADCRLPPTRVLCSSFSGYSAVWFVTCTCETRRIVKMSKNTSVFGIYADRELVSSAVDSLRAAGFRNTDISALFPANEGTKDFAHEKN